MNKDILEVWRKICVNLNNEGYSHSLSVNKDSYGYSVWLVDENNFCQKTYIEKASQQKTLIFLSAFLEGLKLGIL